MTQRTYAVQTRPSYDSTDWQLTGEKATAREVRRYNDFQGWERARLVDLDAEKLRANMAALGHMHIEEDAVTYAEAA